MVRNQAGEALAGSVRDPSGFGQRAASLDFARAPQAAALRAVLAWARERGFQPSTLDALAELIEAFGNDPNAPNLELVMRQARARIAHEARRTDVRPGALIWQSLMRQAPANRLRPCCGARSPRYTVALDAARQPSRRERN